MNALVKKEVRLLLPGAGVVLLLEAVAPWINRDADATFGYMPLAFFLGLILLAVDAFGREFTLGTFQSLMSQPVERERIWRTKITLLLAAAGMIFLAYAVSCGWRVHNAIHAVDSIWQANPVIIRSDYHNAMFASAALILVAVSGGLWASLLLRQTATAFWVTFLSPLMLLMLLALCTPSKTADHVIMGALYCLAVVYSAVGFWLAYRLFFRAQDVGWSGGSISFSRWRYFESGEANRISLRQPRPWTALLKKEFQLHGVSLFCITVLLALHLLFLLVRMFYIHGSHIHGNRDSMVYNFANCFWFFWLVVPAIIGCSAVAEERKLGMMNAQFCLPVSRRRQFAVKFLPALVMGVFFGGVLPVFIEIYASRLGLPTEFFKPEVHSNTFLLDGYDKFLIAIVAVAVVLAILGFLASTLARSFLQAVSLTIVGGLLAYAAGTWTAQIFESVTPTPFLVGLLVIPATVLWLIWRNFNTLDEGWRFWWRNVLSVAGAFAAVAILSAGIYFRAWEVFQPVEPAHGIARLTLADAPKFDSASVLGLGLQWPSGRVGIYTFGYPRYEYSDRWSYAWAILTMPAPEIVGSCQWVGGSNWVSLCSERFDLWDGKGRVRWRGYRDSVGIRRDGTLWVVPAGKVWQEKRMQQFGGETNWRQVVRTGDDFLLLKGDGSLWWWSLGTNRWLYSQDIWPTVLDHPLLRLGTDSDWKEVAFDGWFVRSLARKGDGSTWQVVPQSGWGAAPTWERAADFDGVALQTLVVWGHACQAYIGAEGILEARVGAGDGKSDSRFRPLSPETNWVAATVAGNWLVALKKDGTLWKWNRGNSDTEETFFAQKPVRLGIHNDWVGLCTGYNHPVTMAADGSLWLWPGTDRYDWALMRPPKQPHLMGNVLNAPIN